MRLEPLITPAEIEVKRVQVYSPSKLLLIYVSRLVHWNVFPLFLIGSHGQLFMFWQLNMIKLCCLMKIRKTNLRVV